MIPISLDSIGSLAVVGMAKNVGKTTLLNQIARQESGKRQLGFVSLGIDGEERDAWSGLPKPTVFVPAGSWIATSRNLIQWEDEYWDYVEGLGTYTLMGELVVAHTTADLEGKLAGIGNLQDLQKVLDLFRKKQLLALVDGAYNRKSFARPTFTDAMILVIGGTVGRTEDEIIRKTIHWLQLAHLPVSRSADNRKILNKAIHEKRIWGMQNGKSSRFPVPSLFSLIGSRHEWNVLHIPGAITDKMLRFFIDNQWFPTLIVADWTHLFVSPFVLRTFQRKGGRVEILHAMKVQGIAINPTTPDGRRFDENKLENGIKQAAKDISVWVFEKE